MKNGRPNVFFVWYKLVWTVLSLNPSGISWLVLYELCSATLLEEMGAAEMGCAGARCGQNYRVWLCQHQGKVFGKGLVDASSLSNPSLSVQHVGVGIKWIKCVLAGEPLEQVCEEAAGRSMQ